MHKLLQGWLDANQVLVAITIGIVALGTLYYLVQRARRRR